MTGAGTCEDELAQGGDPGGAHGQAEVAELDEHGPVAGGLAGVAAGEQPGAGVVGGDVVVAAGGELVQQRVERRGDGAGRVAEPQPGLAVVVAGEVAGGQPQDAAERLGVEQHQAGGGAGPDRRWLVSVAKRRSRASRRCWVMACPAEGGWRGMSRWPGMWPCPAAQIRNARTACRWWARWVA